jgi:GMP synthase (glutamine-hydrolysing)
MICSIIQHVLFEDLGFFSNILKDKNYELHYHQAGVTLPSAKEFLDSDLTIVMGGPIGVGDEAYYPFIKDELNLIAKRLEANKPILGVCLGAQFMAKALGAKVYPNKQKEIGWSPLEISPDGDKSPLRHLNKRFVLHWHGDTFDLPKGANHLASTPITPNQAFRVGKKILALQFHPELDSTRIEEWLIGHTCELMGVGADIRLLRSDSEKHGKDLKKYGTLFFEEWLEELKD